MLSSAGRRAYLVDYFKAALGKSGKVITTNATADATAMIHADIACVIPHAGDGGFVDALVDVCETYSAKLLFSLHDWEAPFIAPNRDRFLKVGCMPVISSPEVIRLCLDKYDTYLYLKRMGLPSPTTFVDLNEAHQAIASGEFNFPLILKPRCGQGSVFLEVAHSLEELDLLWRLLNQKIGRIESNGLLNNAGGPLLIQQKVNGCEFDVEVVNDLQGNYVSTLSKTKLTMRSGECETAETLEDPRLERLGRQIASALGHIGVLDIDLIEQDGIIYVLEFNPRFGGCYPFSHMAGANLPAAYVAWAQGVLPDPSWLKVRPGIRAMKEITLIIDDRK